MSNKDGYMEFYIKIPKGFKWDRPLILTTPFSKRTKILITIVWFLSAIAITVGVIYGR